MARDYKKEAKWEDSPAQVKRREARNRARAAEERKGHVHKGDGKEVDHVRFTRNLDAPLQNEGNLRVVSEHTNVIKQPKHKRHS